jgi:hypothetical protein
MHKIAREQVFKHRINVGGDKKQSMDYEIDDVGNDNLRIEGKKILQWNED